VERIGGEREPKRCDTKGQECAGISQFSAVGNEDEVSGRLGARES